MQFLTFKICLFTFLAICCYCYLLQVIFKKKTKLIIKNFFDLIGHVNLKSDS